MRVIVVSVAVFLCVTVLVLHRASAEPAEVAQSDVSQFTEVALATRTSPPMAVFPTQTSATGMQRSLASVVYPTATNQPATAAPSPTATVPAPQVEVTEESVEPDTPEVESGDATAEVEPVGTQDGVDATDDIAREPLSSGSGESALDVAELGSLVDDPAWSDAIHTRDGGVIGLVISGTANVRAEPTTSSEVVVELHDGWPVTLYAQVQGEWAGGTDIWYQTWSGSYVSASVIAPFIAPEPETIHVGHWLDVNLSLNYAIAYVDDTPVNAMIVMTGMEGFETPVGDHTIFRRVETDTLDAGTLGYEEDDPEYYYLTGVNYVQYFAEGGFALHSNYWSDPWEFGLSRSHGCINLMEEDAAWLWLFLDAGSVVSVHY